MRLLIYQAERSRRALAVLECTKLTRSEARLPGNTNLASLEPGMIVCPAGEDGRPNRANSYTVDSVEKKRDEWIIKFKGAGAGLKENEYSTIVLPEDPGL
jgi:hypothetical protein